MFDSALNIPLQFYLPFHYKLIEAKYVKVTLPTKNDAP